MRKLSLLLSLLFLFPTLIPPPLKAQQSMTDEERKRAFLRARGVKSSRTESAATPTPRPRPSPSPSPSPRAVPTRQARPVPKATPKPTPRPKTKPRRRAQRPPSTPEPTPEPTPERRRQSAGKPSRERSEPSSQKRETVVVEKSGFAEDDILPPPAPEKRGFWIFGRSVRYKYLTPEIRRAIDRAPVARHRWRYIVVHNSATRQGSAKAFNYYHTKVRKMPNGLAYHFVIGNGTSTGDGLIEIGNRWTRQINGGHVHSDYLNNISLGICFVGDFDRDKPTRKQLEALDELIRYLRRRVGKVNGKEAIIKAHKDINPRPTSCPGNYFPYRWLYTHFDKRRR